MTSSGGSSPASHKSAPRKRFTLGGRSASLDPLRDVVRPDLADIALADRVFAPHYAQGAPYRVTAPVMLYALPKIGAEGVAALDDGDLIDLFDISAQWAWVRSAKGVGYLAVDLIVPV